MDELRRRRDENLTCENGRFSHAEEKIFDYLSMVERDDEIPLFTEFWNDTKWVNVSCPANADDFKGRVLVLDFWTFCCINCMHIMPVRV